ncbi:MAG TPA: hypothetical protein VGA20_06155 [Gemmatimonadales bacterium]|jgi:hypothetical protein
MTRETTVALNGAEQRDGRMPTYAEILDPRPRRRYYPELLEAMRPGEVRAVHPPRAGTRPHSVASSLHGAARSAGISIRTLTRDGVVYVARLRSEDITRTRQ